MKISIRWIFDHIDSSWNTVDIAHLVKVFNEKTAEIEHVDRITVDLSHLTLLRVTQVHEDGIIGLDIASGAECSLPARSGVKVGDCYSIRTNDGACKWAMLSDFASEKEGLFPAIHGEDQALKDWKHAFEAEDVILHVDNKSVTHRPDLWGHRGFAREIAALLDLPFADEKHCLAAKNVQAYDHTAQPTQDNPFTIAIKDTERCKRFAGLYFSSIDHQASALWMAARLARIDARPIDFIVDATNYVMFDVSQPLHAFDAAKIPTRTIEAQRARPGQKLKLLDDQTIELTDQDTIISDGDRPLALAGVMGGKDAGVSAQTKTLFLESANFNATGIRRSSVRFKVRSEASARFEKTLDPNQNITGILRFLRLLDDAHLPYTCSGSIASLGTIVHPIEIAISHAYIERHIGTKIDTDFVIKTLQKIQFGVQHHDGEYRITVPTYRATKDIGIKEDIVEEIARFYGYDAIPERLPEKITRAHSLEHVYRLRSIKQVCAYSMVMREVYNYAFFDEPFLNAIGWEPRDSVAVKNPVSERYRRLVTTLIPGLLQSLESNNTEDTLRFFEWGRVWRNNNEIEEAALLAGVLFDKKSVDFYDAKAILSRLFSFLEMSVEWQKIDEPQDPWWMPYQTAQLLLDGKPIGIAGKVDTAFLNTIIEGDAFVFELDGDALLSYIRPQLRYTAPSKYPAVERDISILVPLRLTVRHVMQAIKNVDARIEGIRLLDMFEKQEWAGSRALTFRFIIQAQDRTLTKEEAEVIWQQVSQAITDLGATVR